MGRLSELRDAAMQRAIRAQIEGIARRPLTENKYGIVCDPNERVYLGTLPAHVVAKRRAANKAARKARRVNR